ncbi:MAG: hypothetical protein QXG86_00465 [Candidatus Woesearchaeota archaeon]
MKNCNKYCTKPKAFKSLSYSLINPNAGYFPRKKSNQLCVVVNTQSNLIYPVPINIEHIDFASKILGFPLGENLEDASKIVPSNIFISATGINDIIDKVIKVETGISGMEIGYGLRHTYEQLQKAHNLVKNFVLSGEVPVSLSLEEKIITKYAIK